jgi:VWFA-related protein
MKHLRLSLLRSACILGIITISGTYLLGQKEETPTIRVEAREVVLDVVVTDRKGNFVNGLTQGEFTILEDKAKQKIISFQPPSVHMRSPEAPAVNSSNDLTKIGTAPVTILVLDELNTQFTDMAYARGSMEKWLSEQPAKLMQPTALMVASDEKFAVIHDYTQNRDELLAALKKHFPSYPFRMSKGGSVGPDAGTRMAMSLGTLVQIAQASTGTPGRKNVIWVGVGFPSLMLDDVSGTKEDEITAAAANATLVLLKARVTLNVIDPTAMASSSLDMNNPEYLTLDALQRVQGATAASVSGILNFDAFAPATGGHLFVGRNDVDSEIAQAVDNGSNYYTISYAPTNKDDNPAKFRNISVVMRDPNLVATTRTGYFQERQLQPGEKPPPPPTQQLAFDLTSAALNTLVYNGLAVTAVKSPTGYILHVGSAAIQPHVLSNGSKVDEVTIMQVYFRKGNAVVGHSEAELKAGFAADAPLPPIVDYAVPLDRLPRDAVRIRFVVRDAVSGHIGTADVQVP